MRRGVFRKGVVWRFLVLAAGVLALGSCGGGGGGGGDGDGGSPPSDEVKVELGLPGPGDPDNYFPMAVGDFLHFQGTISVGGTAVDYRNSVNMTGINIVNGVNTLVVRESNTYAVGEPASSYMVKDLNGIATLGTDSTDPMIAGLPPYWEVRFPLTVGAGFVQLDRTGLDFGEDLDLDTVNETVDLYSTVTVVGPGTVLVPAGIFFNAMEIRRNLIFTITLSRDRRVINETATDTAWFAPGVGWVKRVFDMTTLGVRETATEELDAYLVGGSMQGITVVAPYLADGRGAARRSGIYLFDPPAGENLTVALTGISGEADLAPIWPANCSQGHLQRPGTEPEECRLTAADARMLMEVNAPEASTYTISFAPTPVLGTPVNEGLVNIPHNVPTKGQVATRGTSYYAATGFPLGRHTVSITGLSGDADLHVYADGTYSLELDCTLRAPGDVLDEPQECTLPNTAEVYFTVTSGELNRDGAVYNILVH